MSTVDPHAVHAICQQLLDQHRIVGRFSRHGHHDPSRMLCRRRSEQRFSVLFQQDSALVETVDPMCGDDRELQWEPLERG